MIAYSLTALHSGANEADMVVDDKNEKVEVVSCRLVLMSSELRIAEA